MFKKLSKEKRERLVLVGLVTAAVVVGVFLGIIKPQGRAFAHVASEIADQQTKVQNADRLVRSTAEIEQRLEVSRRMLHGIETNMASGDMYSWVIATVGRFKQPYAVDIPQISREVVGDVGLLPQFPYRSAAFQLKGTAFYHDFGRFVADFENIFPHFRIQNIVLEPSGPSDQREKLSFRMEIVALVNPNLPQL